MCSVIRHYKATLPCFWTNQGFITFNNILFGKICKLIVRILATSQCYLNSVKSLIFIELKFCLDNVIFVATPEPGQTRMASPNRNPGTLSLFLFIFRVIKFSFSKVSQPESRLDPKGGSEPEPDLLRRFQLSYQNIFLMLFLFRFRFAQKHFQMVGPQTFTFHQMQLQ